jgi:hypothetical protein
VTVKAVMVEHFQTIFPEKMNLEVPSYPTNPLLANKIVPCVVPYSYPIPQKQTVAVSLVDVLFHSQVIQTLTYFAQKTKNMTKATLTDYGV